ncbi:hypothetical protein LNQ81_06230 [Myroides sp. M-43]|uniref:hypothetical protein n=1 Tax=Myroides oncorhynchi TaxID=2893756 RepID=UPI001E5B855A|nr:hypothetical protein [Myroides oncorhynchi]MCC9042288.1 hypothetical protein [Myroides oncorhynchi]
MANYTYLSIKKDEENTFLFEGKNTLPFFWICLLDITILKEKHPIWEQLIISEEEDDNDEYEESEYTISPSDIILTKETFNTNAKNRRIFIVNQIPEALTLYDDFISCIDNQLYNNAVVCIELLEYICFYDDVQYFITSITKELQALDTLDIKAISYLDTHDLINNGTGFTSIDNGDFSELASYKQAEIIRNTPKPDNTPYKKGDIMSSIYPLLICIAFSGITYWMYIEDSPLFAVIFIGSLNLFFYYVSFRILLENIKKRNAKTTQL